MTIMQMIEKDKKGPLYHQQLLRIDPNRSSNFVKTGTIESWIPCEDSGASKSPFPAVQ